jgi:hypothetical protein
MGQRRFHVDDRPVVRWVRWLALFLNILVVMGQRGFYADDRLMVRWVRWLAPLL